MPKRDSRQITMLDDIDRYAKAESERRAAFIQEKLRTEYTPMYNLRLYGNGRDIPDGLVGIVTMTARTAKSDEYRQRWFRVVVGHHNTVCGPAVHLISCPNAEWPDEPVWHPGHGTRWIYPEGAMWIRNETEFDYDVKWSGKCDECYKNCDYCTQVTGPYPRIKRGGGQDANRE